MSLLGSVSHAGTVTYAYDPLGRLSSASYPDGTCTAYRYDNNGNRTQYASGGAGAPIANNAAITTYQDVTAVFDPRVNDPTCVPLTITAVGAPSHGAASVTGSGTSVTYTPNAGYLGSDSFSYTISNGTQSASATVTMTVAAPVLSPVANNGSQSYSHLTPPAVRPVLSQNIALISSDPYGYPLTVSAVTQGARGAVTISGLVVTYTYNRSVSGNIDDADTFTYTVSDGHGHTATGTISISISIFTNQ